MIENDDDDTVTTMITYSDVNNHSKTQKELLTDINNVMFETSYYIDKVQGTGTNTWFGHSTEVSYTINDKLNGPYNRSFNNGQTNYDVYYVDGNKWGTEATFDKHGNITDEKVYHNGVIKNAKRWILVNDINNSNSSGRQNRLLSETQYESGLPKQRKYIYSNGNYIISVLPVANRWIDGGDGYNWVYAIGQVVTLYDKNNVPIWEIVYDEPTEQYFFDHGKTVNVNKRHDYEVYNYIDNVWTHNNR